MELALIIAVVIEQITQSVKKAVNGATNSVWLTVSVVLGLVFSYGFRIDLLGSLGVDVNAVYPWVNYLFSGLVIGATGGAFHDFIQAIRDYKDAS